MVFYFSATGNTLWAAQLAAKALGEQLVDVAAALFPKSSQPRQINFQLRPDETIGFCFPVHGWRPAPLMRQFISLMQLADEQGTLLTGAPGGLQQGRHFCWALTTAGDDIGETMERLQQCLDERGLQADSLFSLIMPESYVGLPFMDVDKPEKEWAKRRTAELAMQEDILPVLQSRQQGVVNTYKGHWPRVNSRVLGAAFERWIVSDKPFRVDPKRCISCGTCADVCPVGDIRGGRNQQPQWLHTGSCLSCFACYHHCPVQAIAYGNRTKGKGQYYYR